MFFEKEYKQIQNILFFIYNKILSF